jgi:hypothetical protein
MRGPFARIAALRQSDAHIPWGWISLEEESEEVEEEASEEVEEEASEEEEVEVVED